MQNTAQAMKSNYKYSLVEGIFSSKETREILMNLIAETIKHHKLSKLRSWEKTGFENGQAGKRIEELSEIREDILGVIRHFNGDDFSVEINTEIRIIGKET